MRVLGEYRDVSAIENIQVSLPSGKAIALRDLATVEDAYKDMDTYAYVDGETALSMSVMKASGGNTVQVAKDVQAEVEAINEILPEGIQIHTVIDTSEFIQDSINNIVEHGVLGALIAVIVLFLFFRSVRSTLVVVLVIPVSVIATFTLMYFGGQTINVISCLLYTS